jgi:Tfp pilus assembly protein FimT
MMVVIAVMAAVTAGAVPFITGWLAQSDLKTYADKLSASFYSQSLAAEADSTMIMAGLEGEALVFKTAQASSQCSTEHFFSATLRQALVSSRYISDIELSPTIICLYPSGETNGGTIELSAGENTISIEVNPFGAVAVIGPS